MKSTICYAWNGHDIQITAHASARYLWMDYTFAVQVDKQPAFTSSSWNGLCSDTRFRFQHQGQSSSGQVISSGFPCTPVVTQATLVDDSIIGYSQIWIKNR